LRIDFTTTLYLLPGIIIGFTFHEFAHAKTAVLLGDDTPRLQGRTSLNPLVHIDIIGFILILIAGFGWAKPVQINPLNFKKKRRDDILVSIAGPLMNIFLACVFLLLARIAYSMPLNIFEPATYSILVNIFQYGAYINVVLCVFNLLPIPPLDGSHILFGLINLKNTKLFYQFSRYGIFVLLALIITNLLHKIIIPPIYIIFNFLSGIFF
jgi:Zn-dependent protease